MCVGPWKTLANIFARTGHISWFDLIFRNPVRRRWTQYRKTGALLLNSTPCHQIFWPTINGDLINDDSELISVTWEWALSMSVSRYISILSRGIVRLVVHSIIKVMFLRQLDYWLWFKEVRRNVGINNFNTSILKVSVLWLGHQLQALCEKSQLALLLYWLIFLGFLWMIFCHRYVLVLNIQHVSDYILFLS